MEGLVGNGAEGNLFFWIGPASAILLVCFFKERRVRFAIPALIMMILIMNPFVKKLFEQITETGYYWRILWIVPIIPCCAALPAMLSEKTNNQYLKSMVAIACIAVFILTGSYTYDERLGRFFPAGNPEKLPEEEVKPLRKLLEIDDHPRVVSDVWMGIFARQFAPQLNMLYGRDMLNYIYTPSQSARAIYNELTSEETDFHKVASIMLDEEYDYLITDDRPEGRKEAILGAGFTLLESTEIYGIYQVHGHPSVRKERNNLGQVISITSIDKEGVPINNEYGWSTVFYEYNRDGYIAREFKTNTKGEGIANAAGEAGFEREYDNRGSVILERVLGSDGKPFINSSGIAEVRFVYEGKHIIQEDYLDPYGKPLLQPAGYTSVKQKWDGENLVLKTYCDSNGTPVMRADGYSIVSWSKDKKGVWNTHFENISGTEVPADGKNFALNVKTDSEGWSDWMTPESNKINRCFSIDSVILDDKKAGDAYTAQIEIEFKNVTETEGQQIRFWTQGTLDGKWMNGNIWNNGLIDISEVPADGIYSFACTSFITDETAGVSWFNIGFRCDYWASGSFRVRKVKIEKGDHASEWSPGI